MRYSVAPLRLFRGESFGCSQTLRQITFVGDGLDDGHTAGPARLQAEQNTKSNCATANHQYIFQIIEEAGSVYAHGHRFSQTSPI